MHCAVEACAVDGNVTARSDDRHAASAHGFCPSDDQNAPETKLKTAKMPVQWPAMRSRKLTESADMGRLTTSCCGCLVVDCLILTDSLQCRFDHVQGRITGHCAIESRNE